MNTITVSINGSIYNTSIYELTRLICSGQTIDAGFVSDGCKYQQVFGICASFESAQAALAESSRYQLPYSLAYISNENNCAVVVFITDAPIRNSRIEFVYDAIEKITGGERVSAVLPKYTSFICSSCFIVPWDAILYSYQLKLYVENERTFASYTREISQKYNLTKDKTIILPTYVINQMSESDDLSVNFFPRSNIKTLDLGKNVEADVALGKTFPANSSASAKIKNISIESIMDRCALCRCFFTDNTGFMNMNYSSNNVFLFEVIKGLCRIELTWKAYVSCIENNPYLDTFTKKKATFDYKYLRAAGYEGSPCDMFCPFCSSCVHCNTMQETLCQKNEIYHVDNSKNYVSIDQARYELGKALDDSVNDGNNYLDLIIGQAGLGKTTCILDIIRRYPWKRFIIAEDTRARKSEVYRDCGGTLYYFPSTLDVLDVLPDEQAAIIHGYLSRGLYKNISAYLQTYASCLANDLANHEVYERIMNYLTRYDVLKSHQYNIVMTHRALFNIRPDLLKGYIVVIDEDPLISCGKTIGQIPIDSVKRAIDCGIYSEKSVNKDKYNLICKMVNAPHDYFFTSDSSKDITYISNAGLNQMGEAPGNLTDFASAKAYHIDQVCGKIDYIKPLRFPYSKVIVMSATADAAIYERYCFMSKKSLQVKKIPEVKYKGTIIQNVSHSLTRREIGSFCMDGSTNPDYIMQRIRNRNPDDICITLKMFEDAFLADGHFGATNGTNKFSGKNITVIGTYYLNEVCYKLFGLLLNANVFARDAVQFGPHRVYYNGFSFKLSTYNDHVLQNVMLYFMNSELEQAVGRARLLDNDVTVTVYSVFPMKQAHITYDDYLQY